MTNDPAHVVDLRRMRTVVEVARAEAITTAAQTLGLTQSAVSRTVAEVEDALGQRLFDRLPRGIQLTDAGRLFVARARTVLAGVDDMVAEVSTVPNRVTGRLRVGVAAAGSWTALAFVDFAREYPDVALETTHASDQTLVPRLLHGEIDLVVGSSSYLQRWRELEVTPLAPLYFAVMVRPGHPLSLIDEPTEAEVLAYPLMLPESIEAAFSDIALRYLHNGLPSPKPRYVTSNPELIGRLIKATDAFFPIMHPDPDFAGLGRHFLLLRNCIRMPLHHVCHARAAQRPKTRVIEIAEQLLARHLQPATPALESA
ncbi:MAG: LysR substrate-binding domain-containing protein [Gammaproteobacteria bacterium]